VRYLARHPSDRAVAGVLACAVPPLMLKTAANPDGAPIELFDGFRAQLLANRAEFYREVTIPFYGYNRPGAKISEGLREKWWLQGMLGSVKAGYDCIKAFSETDFTEDLKKIQIPMLVLHSKDDQIVPIAAAGPRSAELLPNATLKIYEDLPHGLPATAADVFNADVLAFLQKAIPQVIGAAAKATA
jgi:non-heme chloroperoxidase